MANLRGGTYQKQIKDALYRLGAFGKSRYNSNDHKTHSNKLQEKREMYLNDFAKFAKDNNLDKKLNKAINEETIKNFINERISQLEPKTALDYTSGFNSMLKGLEEANINIDKNSFNQLKVLTSSFRQQFNNQPIKIDRYINNIDSKIDIIQANNYASGVIAQIQAETGYRVSEAYEVAGNLNKYLQGNELVGIIGKGNHEYYSKEISYSLIQKIEQIDKLPSYSTYIRDLKEVGIGRSHDIRLTYAVNKYKEEIKQGATEKEALQKVSRELNHQREEITKYYLKRA